MCLWPGYHLHHNTAKCGYSGVVRESTGEWNGAVLSSVMRVCSVCMQVSVQRRPGERLLRSTFTHDTQTHLRLHVVGSHELQLVHTFGFCKVN